MTSEDARRDQSLNDSRLARRDEPPKAEEFLKGGVGGNFLQKVSLPQHDLPPPSGALGFGETRSTGSRTVARRLSPLGLMSETCEARAQHTL